MLFRNIIYTFFCRRVTKIKIIIRFWILHSRHYTCNTLVHFSMLILYINPFPPPFCMYSLHLFENGSFSNKPSFAFFYENFPWIIWYMLHKDKNSWYTNYENMMNSKSLIWSWYFFQLNIDSFHKQKNSPNQIDNVIWEGVVIYHIDKNW